MEVKTFLDLIEWTRKLHAKLAECLAHCASHHQDERASLLLDYLALHETEMEKMVAAFERQAIVNQVNLLAVPIQCTGFIMEL
ncbi:hypothetical protein [Kineobactrum salinum]|uniref:hypothetical protein n=1 Tax=Kineobactrum salinum TaxID=2708301 RepID=UPI0018D9F441|nr:hypothetical protein [Kineobactrum salinum]